MKCFCLLNHELTDAQIAELKNDWHCEEIIYPDEELSYAWGHIPATKDLDLNTLHLVGKWWNNNKSSKGDVIIVQGEAGTSYVVIEWAKKNHMTTLHAVSERKSKDEKMEDGSIKKVSYFEHVCFREYSYDNFIKSILSDVLDE